MKTNLKKYITIALMFSTFLSIFPAYSVVATTEETDDVHFVVGTGGAESIKTLDPAMYDMYSEETIIKKVTDTFFRKDNASCPTLPGLALSQESDNSTVIDLILRQGVNFTDGTPWNAEAAKWNFDRMINSMAWYSYYYFLLQVPSDGFRSMEGVDIDWVPAGAYVPVVNRTQVIDEYTFRILFNVPFDMTTIFRALPIISPTAHADFFYLPMFQDNSFIGPGLANWTFEDDGLVGTGPYKFISFNAQDGEAKLWANMDYWDGPSYITNLTYNYVSSADTLHASLVAGELDLIGYVEDPAVYDENDDIVYENFGEGFYGNHYIVMFDTMPVHVRKAFNYAWNYNYFLDEVMKGTMLKSTGVVYPGVEYYNSEINLPDFNVTRARNALIDGGLVDAADVADWTDADWQAKADGDDPFAEYGINYGLGYLSQAEETREAGRRLGIKVNLIPIEAGNYMATLYNPDRADTADMMTSGMSLLGDFLTYALLIYHTYGYFNDFFLDDAEINEWIGEYLVTLDPVERQLLVDNIADKIQNELFCAIWTDAPALAAAYNRKWDNINMFNTGIYDKVIPYVENAGENIIPGYSIISLVGAIIGTMTILILSKKKRT